MRVDVEVVLAPEIDGAGRWRVDDEQTRRRTDARVYAAARELEVLGRGARRDDAKLGVAKDRELADVGNLHRGDGTELGLEPAADGQGAGVGNHRGATAGRGALGQCQANPVEPNTVHQPRRRSRTERAAGVVSRADPRE